MAFIKAMSDLNHIKVGVNGADVYTEDGVGDYRVTLFSMLNRGLLYKYIKEYVDKIYSRNITDEMCDLFVMAFQTRDIRGGKGERLLFKYFMKALNTQDSQIVRKFLHLIPEYGCWRDMWELISEIPELESDILAITKQQFIKDMELVNSGEHNKLSLLAKWLPREGSSTYPHLAQKIANFLYPDEYSARKKIVRYRKEISKLNKILKTVEINMCGKEWAEIKPESVPGRCLKIHNKAFLNESLDKNARGKLRYPDEADRMECRKHFKEFIEQLASGEKKARGANVTMPHELVAKALSNSISEDGLAINQGQWDSIREETLTLGGLGKCIPMCDFSGSMNGLPKLISLSLGILISEINHNAFKDHILTFDYEPKWHSFTGLKSLKEKLDSIHCDLGQGLNTNFFKAAMIIIQKMKDHKVPVGEEPENLIVLTDMGFDSVNIAGKWETQITRIRNEFQKAGEEVWGVGNGWKPPRIVIWNLRTEYNDFHAKAEQEGVVQLSGWSPSILKAIQKNGVQVMTPYNGMRIILDDERYDTVRKIWNEIHK